MILLSYQGNLVEPVGRWMEIISEKYSAHWIWWCGDEIKLLYRKDEGTCQQFWPIVSRRNTRCRVDRFKYYIQVPEQHIVRNLKRTSATLKRNCYISYGFREVLPRTMSLTRESIAILDFVNAPEQRK